VIARSRSLAFEDDPRVIATVHFPARGDPRADAAPIASTIHPETVSLLADMFALEAEVAGARRLVAAVYLEDRTWRSHVSGIARLLNTYFGRDTWHHAFPTLAAEPAGLVAHAVAQLFGARVTWGRDSHGDPSSHAVY
jgi:hypothetical protein